MRGIKKLTGGLLICLVMMGCNSQSANDSKWKEAAAFQQEALKIGEEVAPQLENLIQRRNSLSVQGRALSQEEQQFIDRVYALEESYNSWKKGANDVQGKIDESPSSPVKMLNLQKEYLDRIKAIQASVAQLLQ